MLRTANDKGKTAINLTGNEYGQTIVGNAGNNILEGKGGADTLNGGGGKDVFVLSNSAVTNPGTANIDAIADYASGDIVDIRQILSVAAGTNVVTGQYLRVTTSGLVQVDVDGGGNNWITLSAINNGGAVSIRYLSGGVQTTVSVSRTAANSNLALAGAVAAAGLVANSRRPRRSAPIMAAPDCWPATSTSRLIMMRVRFGRPCRAKLARQYMMARRQGLCRMMEALAPHGTDAKGLTPPENGPANDFERPAGGNRSAGPRRRRGDAAPGRAHGVAMAPAELMMMAQGGLEAIDRPGPLTAEIARVVAEALGGQSPIIDAMLEALPIAAMEPAASFNPWDAPVAGPMSAAFGPTHMPNGRPPSGRVCAGLKRAASPSSAHPAPRPSSPRSPSR